MDTNKNKARMNSLRIGLIGAFIVLLIYHSYLFYNGEGKFLAIVPPVIFIIVLSLNVRKYQREKNAELPK